MQLFIDPFIDIPLVAIFPHNWFFSISLVFLIKIVQLGKYLDEEVYVCWYRMFSAVIFSAEKFIDGKFIVEKFTVNKFTNDKFATNT